MERQWWLYSTAGFLLGSILFCSRLPRRLCGVDIAAESADHNPGAANVFSLCGVPLGLLCLLLDMLKGALPVFLAQQKVYTPDVRFALVMTAPVLGHALGLFDHRKGGKCIATSFGVLIGILPISPVGFVLAALYILFSTVCKIEPDRDRSIVTFTLFALLGGCLSLYRGQPSIALGCVLISAIAALRHLQDHTQIEKGTEREGCEER